MNALQERLYKALEIIANSNMDLEDALVVDEMTRGEVEDVVNKFGEIVTEWNVNDMYRDSYNFQYYADRIIGSIVSKLNDRR